MFPNVPNSRNLTPVLPEPIPQPMPEPELPIPPIVTDPGVTPIPGMIPFPWWQIRSLRHGCYLTQFKPSGGIWYYNGTIRVERDVTNTIASGDLYRYFRFPRFPRRNGGNTEPPLTTSSVSPFHPFSHQDPHPANGIPIFSRSRYTYYLRITKILEFLTLSNSFTLEFERFWYDRSASTWTNNGLFTAEMKWVSAPAGYPSSDDYLVGEVKDASGIVIGELTMGWVSKYLRRATVEVDRYPDSEFPADNGNGITWQDAFDQVGWEVNVIESDTNLVEPSGPSWSDAELHAEMLNRRDSHQLDSEWRYHLLCVRRLDSTSRGIMYDAFGTDSNNVPREGAAISSHWMIPDTPMWGTVRGMRFGAAAAPYFRTAVHELGHALGLRHNTADNGFMNTTGTIAGNPGTFPNNILWAFNADDAKKLRHMPDAWVRPGEIDWAPSYSAPISPNDMDDIGIRLEFAATGLLPSVPIGAPVRVHVELTNTGEESVWVPASLSLKSEHISGKVIDPAGSVRTFRSVIRCIEDHELEELAPGERRQHDLTLLRGPEGALFSAPGIYQIVVDLTWEVYGYPLQISGSTSVMITPPENEAHAEAALDVLSSPDSLLTLAFGGDHLEDGVSAIQSAIQNDVLRPHFAVVEAKRLGNRFGDRAADVEQALGNIGEDTVLSGAEMKRVAELVQKTKKVERKKGVVKAVIEMLQAKVQQVPTDEKITDMLKGL